LACATGDYAEALARYEQLIASGAEHDGLLEHAGLAALKLGDHGKALSLLTEAIGTGAATWRVWNARGVIADLHSDWNAADAAYRTASEAAPGRVEIVNNQGWSQLLRGDWERARGFLEEAARLDPRSAKIANNLELARNALAEELPGRRAGEAASDWAKRLNDAGVMAQRSGNRLKAIAAFTQALEASGRWYARAANNLAVVTAGR
jgi:Flp pilus assembly protein TadD